MPYVAPYQDDEICANCGLPYDFHSLHGNYCQDEQGEWTNKTFFPLEEPCQPKR